MNQQHEPLQFCDDRPTSLDDDLYQWAIDAGDWIRRLHEENEALRKQLKHAELAASAEASIVDELQAELQEQARVNGTGSERELKLMAENEALRKDAERYRFLRDSQEGKSVRIMFRNEWDAAIDAAMKGQS